MSMEALGYALLLLLAYISFSILCCAFIKGAKYYEQDNSPEL